MHSGTSTPVLPWRSLPRRQGFWGRFLRAANANESLGLHPAFHPQLTVDEAAPRAVSSPSPFSERVPAYPPLKPRAASSRSDEMRWPKHALEHALKPHHEMKFPLELFQLASVSKEWFLLEQFLLGTFLIGSVLIGSVPIGSVPRVTVSTGLNTLPRNTLWSRPICTPVNQEGGLCNTPLYNYTDVGERNDL